MQTLQTGQKVDLNLNGWQCWSRVSTCVFWAKWISIFFLFNRVFICESWQKQCRVRCLTSCLDEKESQWTSILLKISDKILATLLLKNWKWSNIKQIRMNQLRFAVRLLPVKCYDIEKHTACYQWTYVLSFAYRYLGTNELTINFYQIKSKSRKN